MSKLTDKLKARGIHNQYEFYGLNPYLGRRVKGGSRDVLPSAWQVHKANQKLSNAWYDYGAKSFSYLGIESRKSALIEAIMFASDTFGIKKFARDPFGGYGDAEYIKARIKELCTENVQEVAR